MEPNRIVEFSPGERGHESARWLSVHLEVSAETDEGAIEDLRKQLPIVKRMVDAKLAEAGYLFQESRKGGPHINKFRSSNRFGAASVANASFMYEFWAPSVTRKLPGGGTSRGVDRAYPLVPMAFVEGLRRPLVLALKAKHGAWNNGTLAWMFPKLPQ